MVRQFKEGTWKQASLLLVLGKFSLDQKLGLFYQKFCPAWRPGMSKMFRGLGLFWIFTLLILLSNVIAHFVKLTQPRITRKRVSVRGCVGQVGL